jgi:hypothetical protein
MLVIGADWETISSLATGAGTLVLAVATFAAVRSSNRSAKLAEVALQEQRRPVLVASRLSDPLQKLNFADGFWQSAGGGHAALHHVNGNVYMAISLRNVGNGIGVCQGWAARPGLVTSAVARDHMPIDQFRTQTRDLYIPGGDIGMWQGALRNPDDPVRAALAQAIDDREVITIELLYSDLAGRQRTITRFGLLPGRPDSDNPDRGDWLTSISRHWFLDWAGPRPETAALNAAMDTVGEEATAAERAAQSALGIPSDQD